MDMFPAEYRTWVRLTQANGQQDLPILIRIESILSISPVSKNMTEDGTYIMLAGDQRPVKVAESLGVVANAIGWGKYEEEE